MDSRAMAGAESALPCSQGEQEHTYGGTDGFSV